MCSAECYSGVSCSLAAPCTVYVKWARLNQLLSLAAEFSQFWSSLGHCVGESEDGDQGGSDDLNRYVCCHGV